MKTTDHAPQKHMVLSHGLESSPNANKIVRLDALASAQGYQCQRPDYGTTARPEVRIAQLKAATIHGAQMVLAGSSMGAYISAMASLELPVQGLFLLAPPIFLRGEAPALRMRCAKVTIIHGWADELIDSSEVIGFARAFGAKLVLVQDSHRLQNSLAAIDHEFALFLRELESAQP
jgi:predicted alpha/beta-hydrolase family hydrolase